ncbi:hypothetical protein OG401_31495 [Kitasatospora purpeofusca]|uniref:hypothetical protein n=1 Tax=Kitasatospora purpeofusca TaxID=67352 RepID=UPI0022575C75|nr:hypothetical protein [Kitasatospora purpeofusca]MCX4688768.1 hypothetical protein [Kitasatospora purpeofusca]
MRFRTLTAAAITALTVLGTVPAAQAAAPAAPEAGFKITVGKQTPEMEQAVNAARAEATASGDAVAAGPRLCFRAHSKNAGWTPTVCSDQTGHAGTEGHGDPIDRVVLWPSGGLDFYTQVHISNIPESSPERQIPSGGYVEIDAGDETVEALHLRSTNALMKASAHVKDVGWKGGTQWLNDQWIGSIGEGRWMEAFWIDI